MNKQCYLSEHLTLFQGISTAELEKSCRVLVNLDFFPYLGGHLAYFPHVADAVFRQFPAAVRRTPLNSAPRPARRACT
jgi:hypothetical protein